MKTWLKRVLMLSVMGIAFSLVPPRSNAQCFFNFGGACWSGYSTWWISCDCDPGCMDEYPYPPALVCTYTGCWNTSWACYNPDYLEGCYPHNQPSLQCGCTAWLCYGW
jgi:hypothetical protein